MKIVNRKIQKTIILKCAAVVALLMLWMMPAMAQTPFYDYSGKYYIASALDQNQYEYNPTTPANNFYLCPTENWYGYNPSTGGYVNPDGGMPFMTTYKCRNTSLYTPANAVWIIEKYGNLNGKDYYTIKRECDGKYLTHNGQMPGATGNAVNRMRVHLQDGFSEEALFYFDRSSQYQKIIIGVKSVTGQYRYFTVNKGNKPYLQGNGNPENSIGDGRIPLGGIIGLYNANDVNGQWILEELVVRPTITLNTSNNEVTMTAPAGTIYYTINGDNPSFDSNGVPMEGTYAYDTPFVPAYGVTVIKAVAVDNGEVSNVAIRYVPVLFGADNARLIQSQANPWSAPQDLHFYMIPGDNQEIGGVSVTKLNTTSLFRPTMEWYFLDAGVGTDGYTQYYYIVNKAEAGDKRLCYDPSSGGKGVYMDTYDSGNANAFKFSIVESPTAGTYNIIPYGLTSGSRFFNKASNNSSASAVTVHSSNSDANSRWKFVLPTELDREAPFTVFNTSTNPDVYYYFKIGNVNASNYFIIPVNDDYATTSNSSSNERKMHWYFEEAEAATADDWLTYYHIRNAITGEYLYFDEANYTGLNTKCFKTSNMVEAGHEDRYKFTWAKTAASARNYYIVPKLMKDELLNQITTLRRNNGLVLGQTRGADTYAWTFNSSTSFHFEKPTITYSNDDHGYVITSTETGASLYYTTDDEITLSPESGMAYSTPIQVANWPDPTVTTLTIRAIAARASNGTDQSAEAVPVTVYRVATPVITPLTDGTVEITCATSGATIYYEIGDDCTIPDPTTGSTPYSGAIENAGGKYIKAFAVKEAWINSHVTECTQVVFTCATPVIRKTSPTTFTITCGFPSTGVTIRYNIGENHEEPEAPTTTSGTIYNGQVSFVESDLPFTVKAIAYAANYNASAVATKTFTTTLELDDDDYYIIADRTDFIKFISMVNDDDDYASAKYKITATEDINVSGVDEITHSFSGELKSIAKSDGTFPALTGLSHAIFNTVSGGKVKNVMLDNVVISSGTNVGAICNEATGASRIYNCGILATNSTVETDDKGYTSITSCSSTISGTNYVGGLVGLLDGESRVINCFSYADITGGAYVGGIVGYNNVATTAATDNQKTMVMNCMFYGDIDEGCTSKAPIYNGEIITNDGDADGVNNFNYFRSEAAYVQGQHIDVYNCALAAETRFLQRFEFFRHLLNSNRALAAWWVTGNRDDTDEIMKWVMEPSQIGTSTPYPIIKTPGKYPSVVNFTPSETLIDENNEHRNEGRRLGELTVHVQMGSGDAVYGPPTGAVISMADSNNDTTLIITDKDPAHFNFNYGKVQLPYYNQVGTNNYRKASDGTSRVVTGWKIVSITGGTAGSYTTGADVTMNASGEITATPYNFADRDCTNKDKYGTNGSNRIFNQGAYWDVPEGVTAITIEPYWAMCVYLADSYLDVVYQNSGTDAMVTAASVTNIGDGLHYQNGNSYSINSENQLVYTTLANATSALNPSSDYTVYDYAIVLVGNYHFHNGETNGTIGSKPYTVMAIDQDFDNEPDANLIMRFNGRTKFHAVRYDFLNLIGLGMAQKTSGGSGTYNFGIPQPLNWFEVTNTALFRCTQFEYSPADRVKKPIILQGGVVEQWVTQQQDAGDKVTYFHVGGNVWFKEFHRGSHQDNENKSTPHPPVSVTGGDFDEFYLTGLYQPKATIYNDNAECYINGGRFGVMAGAGMEGIGTSEGNGNITWIIDNADINEFYGGGINASKPVFGNIRTIISNSHVDSIFCGGPKFGNMENGRTVITEATNCTFKTFFGAGYGGNSYSRRAPFNRNNIINLPSASPAFNSWNEWVNEQYTWAYNSEYGGVETQINYQFIPHSSNIDNVARLWIEYVGFSLATTHTVSSTLTECTVIGNFYGGGSLGKVDVSVTSVLDGCKVKGNVFGAGFSVTRPPVDVMNKSQGFKTEPHYDEKAGVFLNHEYPDSESYNWEHREIVDGTTAHPAINPDEHKLYTTENLETLGTVEGTVSLTLKGETVVGTEGDDDTGNVFGGGDQSKVDGSTTVILQGKARVLGNVYGGGNKGTVSGNSSVTIE